MGGPGFMRTRIRTTGPNLKSGPHRVPANRPVRLPFVRSRLLASQRRVGPGPVGPGIVKNFVLKRCTSGTVYVNNLWVVCGTPHAARDVGFYSLSLQHTEPCGNSTGRVLSDRIAPRSLPPRGYLDRDLSWIGSETDLYGYGGLPSVCGRFGTRYPAGAELNEIIS